MFQSQRALTRRAGRVTALLSTLGVVVWATGLPALFPSLGPTAYLYATDPESPSCRPARVVGGHAVGVLAGLVAYHLVAGGVAVTATMRPGTVEALRLAASGVLAAGLTTAGMLASDTGHAPACATTLIVGLGILSSPLEGGVIVLAVGVLAAQHEVLADR